MTAGDSLSSPRDACHQPVFDQRETGKNSEESKLFLMKTKSWNIEEETRVGQFCVMEKGGLSSGVHSSRITQK